jgi:hypothetical protein
VKFVLFGVVYNSLQHVLINLEFDASDVFVVLQPLPLETVRVIPIYIRDEQISVFVALPGIVVEYWHGHFDKALDHVAGFLEHLSSGIFLVVVIFSGAGGEFQAVAMYGSSELDIHKHFGPFLLVFDDRYDVYRADSGFLLVDFEDLFIVGDCFVADGVVHVLHAQPFALEDHFLLHHFALYIFAHAL